MKKSGFVAASMAAASATAIAAPSSSGYITNSKIQHSREDSGLGKNIENSSTSHEKFAPKFDGLRFIETLVTAHR